MVSWITCLLLLGFSAEMACMVAHFCVMRYIIFKLFLSVVIMQANGVLQGYCIFSLGFQKQSIYLLLHYSKVSIFRSSEFKVQSSVPSCHIFYSCLLFHFFVCVLLLLLVCDVLLMLVYSFVTHKLLNVGVLCCWCNYLLSLLVWTDFRLSFRIQWT